MLLRRWAWLCTSSGMKISVLRIDFITNGKKMLVSTNLISTPDSFIYLTLKCLPYGLLLVELSTFSESKWNIAIQWLFLFLICLNSLFEILAYFSARELEQRSGSLITFRNSLHTIFRIAKVARNIILSFFNSVLLSNYKWWTYLCCHLLEHCYWPPCYRRSRRHTFLSRWFYHNCHSSNLSG